MRTISFFMMGALLAGCSGFDDLPSDVCQKQHTEDTSDGEIIVCDELYSEAPYVHLPKSESDHAYAGIENGKFRTADGKTFSGVDEGAEMKRHGSALYEVMLDGNSVTDYRPVVKFKDSLFLAPFSSRAAEGTISRRTGAGEWATETSLAVRVVFEAELTNTESSGNAVSVVTRIENMDEAVTASDGSCMPALTSYGDESTFPSGAVVEYRGYRVPSMHHFGDDQFVFLMRLDNEDSGTLMNPTWYRGPIDLARGTIDPSGTYSGVPHGTPSGMPALDIEPVTGGGEPCEAP